MKAIKHIISILIIIVGWVIPVALIVLSNKHPSIQFIIPFMFLALLALLFLLDIIDRFQKWFNSKLIENQNTL